MDRFMWLEIGCSYIAVFLFGLMAGFFLSHLLWCCHP